MRVNFERDDGATLCLDPRYGYFEQACEEWLPAKTLRTSMFGFAGADGGAMVKQSYEPWEIPFSGYIHGVAGGSAWDARIKLFAFFVRGHYYTINFERNDGNVVSGRRAWISEPPAGVLRHKNEAAQAYSFKLTLGDPYLYDYVPNGAVYAHSAALRCSTQDSVAGQLYGGGGYIYYGGGYAYAGGTIAARFNYVTVDSIMRVHPVFTLEGGAGGVVISNFTTNQTLHFNGDTDGSKLIIYCDNGRAVLDGVDATAQLSGDTRLELAPGRNVIKVTYSKNGSCVMGWTGVAE